MKLGRSFSSVWIVVAVFAILGSVFFGIGAGMGISHMAFKRSAVETTATILAPSEYEGAGSYDTYIEYEANGTVIQTGLTESSSSYYPGKQITVYYDTDNPYRVRSDMMMLFFWIFGGVGAAFLLVVFILLANRLAKRRQRQWLLQHGERVGATISGIERNYTTHINGRNPYFIECWWQDPRTGAVHTFRTDNFMRNPDPVLQAWNVTQLPVYLDREKPKRYHIDLSQLQ